MCRIHSRNHLHTSLPNGHWEETCEDDSCYEYGTSILVNGKELVREASIMTAVQSVLKELGIEADIKVPNG